MCILLIDDDIFVRRIFNTGLQCQGGHEVVDAGSGQKGLELAASEKFDVILLDTMLSDMEGFEVLQKLKDDPAAKNIPVFMFTAKGQAQNVRDVSSSAPFITSKNRF